MAQIRPSHMKVICPTAKLMPVSLNAGFEMRSWFDIKTLDISGPEDEAGIKVILSDREFLHSHCHFVNSNDIIILFRKLRRWSTASLLPKCRLEFRPNALCSVVFRKEALQPCTLASHYPNPWLELLPSRVGCHYTKAFRPSRKLPRRRQFSNAMATVIQLYRTRWDSCRLAYLRHSCRIQSSRRIAVCRTVLPKMNWMT